jgi:hypothetical protein
MNDCGKLAFGKFAQNSAYGFLGPRLSSQMRQIASDATGAVLNNTQLLGKLGIVFINLLLVFLYIILFSKIF